MAKDSRCLSVPEYAERLGVATNKVLGWIRHGRIAALNVSNGTRPRYAIPPESIEAFERGISTQPPCVRAPRAPRYSGKDYFP